MMTYECPLPWSHQGWYFSYWYSNGSWELSDCTTTLFSRSCNHNNDNVCISFSHSRLPQSRLEAPSWRQLGADLGWVSIPIPFYQHICAQSDDKTGAQILDIPQSEQTNIILKWNTEWVSEMGGVQILESPRCKYNSQMTNNLSHHSICFIETQKRTKLLTSHKLSDSQVTI